MIHKIDITADRCPMTFVKVKFMLSKMNSGDTLEVTLSGGEPLENVPGNARSQGYIVGEARKTDDHYTVDIKIP